MERDNERNLYETFNDNNDFQDVPEWHHDPSYRQRRDLFKQLETMGTIFNINIKACIKRAMCEMTMRMRPYGESLMEDIVRIILT